MRGWWLRLSRLLRFRRSERDIDDELRFHMDMEEASLRRDGVEGAEARRRARTSFGGEDRWREEVRDTRGTAWVEDAVRDGRTAIRSLRRSPGFALAAIGTIAIGVGSTTAIYSVVEQIVLSPLPYPQSEELVTVWMRNPAQGIEEDVTSWPNFADWRDAATTLERMATVLPRRVTLTGDGEPVEVFGASVSRGFFELMGTPLAFGRAFHDDEVEGDFGSVVVLGHDLFTRRFGADPSVVGRTVVLNDATYEVVGVAAEGAAYPREAEFWTPLAFGTGREWREPRGRLWLPVIGRLAPGADLGGAQREMDAIATRLEEAYPDVNRGVGITLEPLHETLIGDVRTPLLVLLGAVGVVWLIAVVNVANLLLARGTGHARELAARVALGAGRGRMVRQALAGSAVLGLIGGVLGAGLAAGGVAALLAAAPGDLPRLDEVTLDGMVLAVALVTALAASACFGLVPALQATRVDPGAMLRVASRGSAGTSLRRVGGVFVAGQFGLAFVLLVGSGLLLRSFMNLRAVEPGFEPVGVLDVELRLPPGRYPDAEARRAFHQELMERVEGLPGVDGVATISTLFLTDLPNMAPVTVEGRADRFEDAARHPVVSDAVSPGFFEVAGMPILSGRGLLESDGPEDRPVVVVNETFARLHLDGVDPIGRRYAWGRPEGDDVRWFTIVGVVADARRAGVDRPVRPSVFEPVAQSARSSIELLVRTSGDPAALAPAVRGAVAQVDPVLPISRLRTLERAMADSLARQRFVTWILGVFAAAALILAAIGIFGVMAYVVGRRTREIGVRVALGAARGRVLRDVLREGLAQVAVGLALGLVGALGVAGLVRSQLYGLEPTDPTTFVVAALVLLVVAVAACAVPARRAATIDAIVALRDD